MDRNNIVYNLKKRLQRLGIRVECFVTFKLLTSYIV